jgi:putative ABC transport system permease protein
MLHHCLAVALRNLARHELYASINIVGLTIGLAAALIVILYVRHESTYERFLPDYERIYRISSLVRPAGSADLCRVGGAAAAGLQSTRSVTAAIRFATRSATSNCHLRDILPIGSGEVPDPSNTSPTAFAADV